MYNVFMKKMLMNTEIKLAIYQSFKEDLINLLDKVETLISEEYLYIKEDNDTENNN